MKNHFAKLVACGVISALALTGCGSGSSAPEASEVATNGNLQEVTVGVLPIAPSAAMQYGIDEGIFEKYGLSVELQTGQGGAAMLPAVSTGTMNFAVGNPLSVMVAVDKGLDMKIVTGYSNSRAEGEDVGGVVVRADSRLNTFVDLEGKTTAVNTLKAQGDLTMMESAAIDGGDPSKLKFNEMPFPDMEAQLERGNVDAIWIPEPFLSRALANKDNKLLGYPSQKALPGLPTMVTFTSGSYARQNPIIVGNFKAAVTEVLTAAEADPDGVRAVLPEFMGMDAAIAENLKMETFDAEVPAQVLNDMGDLMLKYGYVKNQPHLPTMAAW